MHKIDFISEILKNEKPANDVFTGFLMAGAEGLEPSTRGFGGVVPNRLKSTYLHCFSICCLEKYDGFTTVSFYTIFSVSSLTLVFYKTPQITAKSGGNDYFTPFNAYG